MPRSRLPYAPEFKEEAVRLVRESGKSIADVSGDPGVSGESIRKWVKQYEIDAGLIPLVTETVIAYRIPEMLAHLELPQHASRT